MIDFGENNPLENMPGTLVKFVPSGQSYQPDYKKPVPQPQGHPPIVLHFKDTGQLIGLKICSTDVEPIISGSNSSEDKGVRQMYGIDPSEELFPEFDELLEKIRPNSGRF